MRYPAIAVLVVCFGCASTNDKLPEGRVSTSPPHPEFESIRPTAIAVLKVKAPDTQLAQGLRLQMYDRLFEARYSCMKLDVVDRNTASDGTLDKRLEWDATFRVEITAWKAYHGGRYFAASGFARMVHRHGETLWERTFTDHVVDADVKAGKTDITQSIPALAKFILKELPHHPNPPPR